MSMRNGQFWAAPAACAAAVLCAASAHADVRVARSWAATPPAIDGVVTGSEWDGAAVTTLAHGRMATMNDGRHLYVLLDVTGDTVDDPPGAGMETFTLAFDVDRSRAVTPDVDLLYGTCGSGWPLAKQYYLSPSGWTYCQVVSADSAGAIGFGATSASGTPHRVFELQLDFAEIGVDPATWTTLPDAPHVRVNVGLASLTPAFEQGEPTPSIFPMDFSLTFRIDLAVAAVFPPASTGPTFAGVGFVPASYIEPDGYATLNEPGYSYSVTDAPFGGALHVFGNWADLYARGARSYRVLYGPGTAPPTTPLLETWTNFRQTGTTWSPRAVGPDAAGRYPVPTPAETWYLPNLLVNWRTNAVADGTYTLSLELFDATGGPVAAPAANALTLRVINTPPEANLEQILYAGLPVSPCSIVWAGATPSEFKFVVTAADGNGALAGWSLGATYGDNQHVTIASDGYAAHVGEDGPRRWNGLRSSWLPTTWYAPVQCAYALTVSVSSRSQTGYGPAVPGDSYTKTLTYLAGTGPVGCK